MLDNLFLEVLNLTITGSFVILGVIVARLLMLKFPKKYSYLLWAIVLVRLLVPISWESDLSLMPTTSQPIFTPEMVYETVPQVDTGVEILDQVINPILPPVTQPEASVNPIQIRIFVWRVLWMAGMVGMMGYGLFQYFRLKRRLSTAIPLEKGIYLADHIPSPFVLGLFAPKIYLPSHLEEQERGYIIAHEQCHLKRFDHITRVLAFMALTVHWFNPLVWVAFVLSERDMELSCDEAVMGTMEGDIRRDYANSLLRFATRGRLISATPLAFGEGDTKGRVKNVMGYKKSMVWVTVVAVLLVICVGIGLMFHAEGETEVAPEQERETATETQVLTQAEDWGITLTATNVTTTGLTIVCEQADGGQQGRLQTGTDYWVEIYDGNIWQVVPYLPDEYSISWTAEALIISLNDTTEWNIDWEGLYGALPSGAYRIGKSVMDFIESGNYEYQSYYAEFEVTDESILPIYDSEFVNYDTIFNYLEDEVLRVYSPYYDVDQIELSDYEELDGASYFNMTMYYYHYNRDPDTVEYIAALKEKNDTNYQKLYDEYLGEYQSTWVLKAIVNPDGSIELFSDYSPIGAEVWTPTAIEDYVIDSSSEETSVVE